MLPLLLLIVVPVRATSPIVDGSIATAYALLILPTSEMPSRAAPVLARRGRAIPPASSTVHLILHRSFSLHSSPPHQAIPQDARSTRPSCDASVLWYADGADEVQLTAPDVPVRENGSALVSSYTPIRQFVGRKGIRENGCMFDHRAHFPAMMDRRKRGSAAPAGSLAQRNVR